MKELFEKLALGLLRAKMSVKDAVENVVDDERGDTNFISIAIILIIVIVIALVIIAFSDNLQGWLKEDTAELQSALGH